MPDGLAFTLYAPLAAMGDLAVGERRGGFDRPARSAILGLVAAALGLNRTDEDGHAALDQGYRLAQRVRLTGALVIDYHTVQAPPADRKARWTTRREALDRPSHELNTLLSSRDYRADIWVDVALIRFDGSGPPPEVLAAALRHPAYTLFFGRKSCPLGLPLVPVWTTAVDRIGALFATLDETFVTDDPRNPEPIAATIAELRNAYERFPSDPSSWTVFADRDLGGDPKRGLPDMLAPDYRPLRIERRRDRVASRLRRQFELRDEIVAAPAPVGAPP